MFIGLGSTNQTEEGALGANLTGADSDGPIRTEKTECHEDKWDESPAYSEQGLHGATNVFSLSFKIGTAINNLLSAFSAQLQSGAFCRAKCGAAWQQTGTLCQTDCIHLSEWNPSSAAFVRQQQSSFAGVVTVLVLLCYRRTGKSDNSDAVRKAISSEGKKLPVVMSALVFVRPLLWQVNKTYNLTGSNFFPNVSWIQKYMCMDGEGTFGREKKNKAFPEWQSDSCYN